MSETTLFCSACRTVRTSFTQDPDPFSTLFMRKNLPDDMQGSFLFLVSFEADEMPAIKYCFEEKGFFRRWPYRTVFCEKLPASLFEKDAFLFLKGAERFIIYRTGISGIAFLCNRCSLDCGKRSTVEELFRNWFLPYMLAYAEKKCKEQREFLRGQYKKYMRQKSVLKQLRGKIAFGQGL